MIISFVTSVEYVSVILTCTHLLFISLALSLGVAVEIQRPRGGPKTKQLYDENQPFTCLDGSRTIPFDCVNDNCDCKDGSVETGTSACPNGNFHCTNAGYRPTFFPSSRINDGVYGSWAERSGKFSRGWLRSPKRAFSSNSSSLRRPRLGSKRGSLLKCRIVGRSWRRKWRC